MFVAGEMTGEYLSFILLKNKITNQATKLLDTKNIYTKPILNPLELISQNNSSILNTPFCLTDSLQYGPSHKILLPSNHGWLRLSGDFTTPNKEWESWKMTQMIIKYFKNGKEIGNDALRIQRHLQNGNTSNIYIDSKIIGGSDEVEVSFWNSGGTTTLCAENIDLIYHEGK